MACLLGDFRHETKNSGEKTVNVTLCARDTAGDGHNHGSEELLEELTCSFRDHTGTVFQNAPFCELSCFRWRRVEARHTQ